MLSPINVTLHKEFSRGLLFCSKVNQFKFNVVNIAKLLHSCVIVGRIEINMNPTTLNGIYISPSRTLSTVIRFAYGQFMIKEHTNGKQEAVPKAPFHCKN